MKKIVVAIATSVMFAGVAVNSVSAEEYEVEKGDSLWTIAKAYDTTVDDLIDINDLKNSTIHPKQKLRIHETYVVEKGDTLYRIGKQYDVSVKDIKKWNNLDSNLIVVGQELEINGGTTSKQNQAQPEMKKTSKQKTTKKKAAKAEPANTEKLKDTVQGETLTVTATAYTAKCKGCSGITSTGINLNKNPNAKVIAVDPNVIPLGSKVYVEGYGYATAGDVGGAIKGNRIDIHVPTEAEATNWGVKKVKVTIVN